MSFHHGWARGAPFLFACAFTLVACVGDSVTPSPGVDASTEASTGNDAATDTGTDAPVDAGGGDAPTEAAPPDSGVCSNAQPGNTVNLPASGNFTFAPQSTALKAGTYNLTEAYYSCNSCSVVSASATGGLVITIVGQTVTLERRIDLQEQGQPLQSVADRWSGTFDQLNQNFAVARDCPSAAPSTNWFGNVPPTDAGKSKLHITFGSEFQVKDKTTSSQYNPTFVFTQL